jgi:hypothetical protein
LKVARQTEMRLSGMPMQQVLILINKSPITLEFISPQWEELSGAGSEMQLN